MRRSLAVVLVGFLAALVPATGALAQGESKDFTFFGSGFGHGLGMSQWGAYGLALQSWGAKDILAHYYSGADVAKQGSPPDRLRIGLVQAQDSVRLEAEGGDVEIRLGDRKSGEVVATIPDGQTWRIRSADGRYRIVNADGGTVGRFGGPGEPIFAVYGPQGALVRIPEASHSYKRGWIEFGLYSCGGECDMRLILEVTPQEYLYGLGEVPSSWPMEALRAQAIAARTYAFTKAAISQHRSGCDCALYASSFDQVYAGWDKEAGIDGDRWVEAVDVTKNQVVVYEGATIQAFYMSSSGGFTEDNENVWGGTPIGYLRGVCDPGDYTADNPSATWQVTYAAPQVTKELSLGIGTVIGFVNPQRGISGRIISITVKGENGEMPISGATLRSALGLRDDRVWINRDRQIVGAIRQKYDALGCSPGLPLSRQVVVAGGVRQTFEDATIYFREGVGVHALGEPVLGFYLGQGGPGGALGFPTSDGRTMGNGNLRANFEHGKITCSEAGCRLG